MEALACFHKVNRVWQQQIQLPLLIYSDKHQLKEVLACSQNLRQQPKSKKHQTQNRGRKHFLISLEALLNSQEFSVIRLQQNNQKMSPLKICLQVSKIQKKLHQRNRAKLRQESLDRHSGHRLRQTQRKNRQLNQLDNLSRINLKPNLKLPKLNPSARMTFRKKHLRQSRSRVSPSYGSPKSKKTKNNSKKPHPNSKSMS